MNRSYKILKLNRTPLLVQKWGRATTSFHPELRAFDFKFYFPFDVTNSCKILNFIRLLIGVRSTYYT